MTTTLHFQLFHQEVLWQTIYTALGYLEYLTAQRTRYFIQWLFISTDYTDALQAIGMDAREDSGILVSITTNRAFRHAAELFLDVT